MENAPDRYWTWRVVEGAPENAARVPPWPMTEEWARDMESRWQVKLEKVPGSGMPGGGIQQRPDRPPD